MDSMRNAFRKNVMRLQRGFTLIELMVVIAIIALLVAILLPSLQSAREHAKTVVCKSNLHHVSQSMANYLYVSAGIYPASYLYPYNVEGEWNPKNQPGNPDYGYVHWSSFLYDDGNVGDKAFQCPKMKNGGHPRTNPGLKPDDWELGEQEDGQGQTVPNDSITDRQAPRMAYSGNAAIFPRNKFTTQLSGGQRKNVFVRDNMIKGAGKTILAAEFLDNWKAIGIGGSGGSGTVLSKSHRPIQVFQHVGSGYNEYGAIENSPGFVYRTTKSETEFGLLPLSAVRDASNLLDYTSGLGQINAVGRHHPTANQQYRKKFGGNANFLFCDGHAEETTALETMEQRMWGERFFSISGENEILRE